MAWGRIGAVLGVAALAACFVDDPAEETTRAATMTGGSTSDATTGLATTSSSTSSGDPSTSGDPETSSTGASTTTGGPAPVKTCPELATLVLCYELEEGWEGGLLIDSSASAHHGLMSDVSQVVGHKGSAALMAEASLAYATYDAAIFSRLQGAFTVGAWVKPAAGMTSGRHGIAERDGHFRLALVGGASYKASCETAAGGEVLTSAATLPVDAWTHVACVYDGATLSLWVGGGLAGETAVVIPSVGNHLLQIGNDGANPGPEAAFLGAIDELQIFEVALKEQGLCSVAGIESCGLM